MKLFPGDSLPDHRLLPERGTAYVRGQHRERDGCVEVRHRPRAHQDSRTNSRGRCLAPRVHDGRAEGRVRLPVRRGGREVEEDLATARGHRRQSRKNVL